MYYVNDVVDADTRLNVLAMCGLSPQGITGEMEKCY